ncbi:site-specific integrase [Solirubrobacter sp. CPCC 204708]|uniref:Site-specific integrase n=1 Tax=Solirubrobacter deserti TaxID=2282478 RepID=A0ABT4RIG9_9ACTN|nr:tyrosine-type recombinase/integrase [Solirubrobacter deserti]MBE2316567.1 site-specific integrase [Solirubrobacter deserti]MDA0138100.1 site-specific integrase [Solirubrobacter deserti]
MANWRKTRMPGVYVAHSKCCPAYDDPKARCRCTPSWRGRRRNPFTGKPEWQRPVVKNRAEVLAWLSAARDNKEQLLELAARGPLFEELASQWLDGVEQGRIGRRRGKGKPYAETTILAMGRSLKYHLLPVFGPMHASEISEIDWQRWIDKLARKGLSRSTIAKHISVASDIYAWASAPSRRLVSRNPLRLVELPPNDEKPRLRVALAPEAAALLAALEPEDRVPYAIAFYAGLRRSEIDRLEWPDVLEGDGIARRVLVRRSKSEAGTQRRPPIGSNLRDVLEAEWKRRGRPREGKVLAVSVMSGKIASRVEARWDAAGLNRITLHECRHTYASLLMAAGYTIKELMEYMGHADLQMVNRYVKLLPQPGEDDAADRLNAYLRRSEGH